MESFVPKIAAGVVIAVVLAASLGYYLSSSLPVGATYTPANSSIINVYQNDVLQVGPLFFGSSAPVPTFGLGIWQFKLGVESNAPVYVTTEFFVGDYIMGGNSTALAPGANQTVVSCGLYPLYAPTRFDVVAFVTNQSGLVVPHYPVTLLNASHAQLPNQISVSNTLHSTPTSDPTRGGTYSHWVVSVRNTASRSINYIYVELSNGTRSLGLLPLRCAGATSSQSGLPMPAGYRQPLAPGQTASYTTPFLETSQNHMIQNGKIYQVTVVAVFEDNSEVVQTYNVEAAP